MIPYTIPILIDAYLTVHTNAVGTTWTSSRTSDLYQDLGITFHPHECDTEDIVRNVTQLSAGEVLIAPKFGDLLAVLKRNFKSSQRIR